MSDVNLPPCGLYRTLGEIGEVPAGRLVYFHNHGDPGPGVYLPARWANNKAVFAERGHTLPDPAAAAQLEPLEREGFYRVRETFHCCAERCREFQPDMLVQLGYDGSATPILFVPELVGGALGVPDRGTRIDREAIAKLARLRIPETHADGVVH